MDDVSLEDEFRPRGLLLTETCFLRPRVVDREAGRTCVLPGLVVMATSTQSI